MISHNQTVIRPASKIAFFDVKELWRYRDLLYMLAARDVCYDVNVMITLNRLNDVRRWKEG